MHFKLPYGRSELNFDLPEHRVKGVLSPKVDEYPPPDDEQALVKEALKRPIDSPRLKDLARGCGKVVVICSDHTRPVPSKYLIPPMLKEIRSENPQADVKLLIATGVHRPPTRKELVEKFGEDIVANEKLVIHQSTGDDMTDCGTLPSGGRLLLNRTAVEADLLVAEGFIEPHLFAGYSGGRKSVLPGIASQETVMANHCAEFIAHKKARTGVLDGNPIHEDMIFAARKAGLSFILNTVIDRRKRIIKAFAGHFQKAHMCGCDFLAKLATVRARPAGTVITSNGGYPMDQNIYQSVKGMAAAEATCREGGVIIIAARCCDGHGGEDFYRTFQKADSIADVMEPILRRNRTDTLPDQWESQILAGILDRLSVVMVTSAPRRMVEDLFMTKAETMEEALDRAEELRHCDDSSITVIPDGVGVIVRP